MVEHNKAKRSSKGDRVLCESLSVSALSVQFGGTTLEPDSTLEESNVKNDSVLEITRAEHDATTKPYDQVWDVEKERQISRQNQRMGQEAKTERQKRQKQEKEAEVQQRALAIAANTTDMLQKQAEEEILAREIKDQGGDMENREALKVVNGGIYVERSIEREHMVPKQWAVDPYDDEDADKENWDPHKIEASRRIP